MEENKLPTQTEDGSFNGHKTALRQLKGKGIVSVYQDGPQDGEICHEQSMEIQGADLAKTVRELVGERIFQFALDSAPMSVHKMARETGAPVESVVAFFLMMQLDHDPELMLAVAMHRLLGD